MRRKTGSIQKRGLGWRIAYTDVNGRRQFETILGDREDAERELNSRIADTSKGIPVSARMNAVTLEDLSTDVLSYYQVNKLSSYPDMEARFRCHINPRLGTRKASQITTGMLNAYILRRKAEASAPSDGTVNRELEAIKRAFKLGLENCRVLRMPKIPRLKENNVRKGFFSREEVVRLCTHLKHPYDSFVTFAFLTGWRYGEIRGLQWVNVDFAAREIRLDPGTTKNGEGRIFPMTDELRQLLRIVKDHAPATRYRAKADAPTNPVTAFKALHVFAIDGKPLGQFRKTWATACQKAGLPVRVEMVTAVRKRGKRKGQSYQRVKRIVAVRIFHDLRRSAARNLLMQGISERVVMQLCGWKTRGMLDRYAIIADTDVQNAMERMNRKTS